MSRRNRYIARDCVNQVYDRRLYGPERKPYGFFAFMGDIFMTLVTGGLWLIWIFVREMRGR